MATEEPAHPPCWAQALPGILTSFLTSLSGSPSPWGLLTQGSIQVLEDTAAVVQGDVDPFLQERGDQAAAGTGTGEGWGPITLSMGSLPAHVCHFLSPHLLCPVTLGRLATLGSTGPVALLAENQGLSELEGI